MVYEYFSLIGVLAAETNIHPRRARLTAAGIVSAEAEFSKSSYLKIASRTQPI